MIILTDRRRRKLEEVIKQAIFTGIWHHDTVLLETDQSNIQRLRTIQDFVEQEFEFYFHRRPWWKFWNRPKKCKPIPCPPVEQFDFAHIYDDGLRPKDF